MKIHNPSGVAAPTGPYSHAIETTGAARWLHISGQVGRAPDGSMADDIAGQSEQVWRNLVAVLAGAGMTTRNLVKVTAYLTRPEHTAAYGAVRSRFLGDARPASTLLVIQALAQSDFLVEVEAIAAAD
ncbi:MAG: endoribonuclease family protein 15 [Rhodospirillales bacterium]|jgi:2-iminobutanoate/2-iminopropanoate deaminase|nr:endoribonuclease family protein 15 [Rhodospirillales bacterium]